MRPKYLLAKPFLVASGVHLEVYLNAHGIVMRYIADSSLSSRIRSAGNRIAEVDWLLVSEVHQALTVPPTRIYMLLATLARLAP